MAGSGRPGPTGARAAAAALRQRRPAGPPGRARRDGHHVRLRHHPIRRDPPRSRRHISGVRPGVSGVAGFRGSGDYVQNVTDVDDPLLERAAATVSMAELAERETERFRDDMDALRVLPAARVRRGHRGHRGSGRGRRKAAAPTAPPTSSTTPSIRTCTSVPTPQRSSGTSRATTATRCGGCSPSAAATRIAPARATNWTPCCGWRSDRTNPAGRRRSVPVGPVGMWSAPRSRSAASAPAWTSRAAEAIWSSRTTSSLRPTPNP